MKSNEALTPSDQIKLLEAVYIDATSKCTADVSDLRDLKTIRSRVKSEGLSFLTIRLPLFADDFTKAISQGFVDSTLFLYFRKNGLIPAFLQGITSQLFDRETGRYIDANEDETHVLVEAVRQICLLFKKLEEPCSPRRIRKAIENYVNVEHSVRDFHPSESQLEYFSTVSRHIWDNMLGHLRLDMFQPRHGPGATAERISGNQKYVWRRWHERLEPFVPFFDNAYSMGAIEDQELIEKVTFVPEDEEDPVRIVFVPKTLKSPRVIAIEPVCMQYAQQQIQQALYRAIEDYPLTRGHVNFTDQSTNRYLALTSSASGLYSTIDLSDASDRVPRDLALRMFDVNPDLRDYIDACRSKKAQLPDGRVIELSKFASMGSALCFPVESMYFYTLCVMALLDAKNLRVNQSNILHVTRFIYVYGDDIVVPTDQAVTVLDYLQKYNCKVNVRKTYVTGKFRESCGLDAYAGEEVTPTYLRQRRPRNRQQASELISWVATANQFYRKGYWRAASLMYSTCERVLGDLPYVPKDSAGLGRISFMGMVRPTGYNCSQQSLYLRAWVPEDVYRCDEIDGYPALRKSLQRLALAEDDPFGFSVSSEEKPHLEHSALRGAVTLKRRWVRA